jgi:hypothetical protein
MKNEKYFSHADYSTRHRVIFEILDNKEKYFDSEIFRKNLSYASLVTMGIFYQSFLNMVDNYEMKNSDKKEIKTRFKERAEFFEDIINNKRPKNKTFQKRTEYPTKIELKLVEPQEEAILPKTKSVIMPNLEKLSEEAQSPKEEISTTSIDIKPAHRPAAFEARVDKLGYRVKKFPKVNNKYNNSLRVGAQVAEILNIDGIAKELLPEKIITSAEDFLKKDENLENIIFPQDYISGKIERTAQIIYNEVKDNINTTTFEYLLAKYTLGGAGAVETEKLSYVGKTAAILERAGIQEISIIKLSEIYSIIPKVKKKEVFSSMSRNRGISLRQYWGQNYLEGIISDKNPSRIDINIQRSNYETLSLLGAPWVKSLYLAFRDLGMYTKHQTNKIKTRLINKREEAVNQ